MFWRKKTAPASKGELIIESYLAVTMALLSERLSEPTARAGVQVFILGMVDMLRQAEGLSWKQFIAIYEAVLGKQGLLPSVPVGEFVNKVGEAASTSGNIESVMRQGAQSITLYVSEQDANASMDLLGVPNFASKHASSFANLL